MDNYVVLDRISRTQRTRLTSVGVGTIRRVSAGPLHCLKTRMKRILHPRQSCLENSQSSLSPHDRLTTGSIRPVISQGLCASYGNVDIHAMEMEMMTVTLAVRRRLIIDLRRSQQQHGGQLSGSFSRRIRPIYRHWVSLYEL